MVIENVKHAATASNYMAQFEKKPRKKALRYSVFLLTWNSNTKIFDQDDPKLAKLEEHVFTWFDKFQDNILTYINIKEENDKQKPIDEIIARCETEGHSEIGTTSNCFHFHAFIKINHRTKIALNVDKIRSELKSDLAAGCYVNVTGTSDKSAALQNYIKKYNEGKK